MEQLHRWRTQLFSTIAAGLGFLLSITFCVALALVLWLCDRDEGAEISAWLALGCWLIALGF